MASTTTTGGPATARSTDLSPRTAGMIVTAIAAMFVLLYGALVLRRFEIFSMHAFDLGIFDQGLWLLSRFESPFVTVRGLDLFADHTSFAMVLLTPLYWIWSDVRMLIGFTTVVIAAGIPLTYAVARASGLGRRWGVVLAAAYALHPAAAWNVRDSFHPEVIAIPLLIAAYLMLLRNRPGAAMALIGVVLLAKEDAALVVVPFGLYVALVLRRRIGWWMAGAGIAAFVLAFGVILPLLSPTGELLYTSRYQHLGTGLGGILWGLLTRPHDWIPDLLTLDRMAYLAAVVLPLPVCLAAPRLLAVAAPATLANLLSTHTYQFDIKYHYTAYLLPVVVLAAIEGTTRLTERPPFGADASEFRRFVVGVLIAGHLIAAPFPLGVRHTAWNRVPDQLADYRAAIALIPEDAPVAASSGFVPHLSHRILVYEFPNPWDRYNYGYPGIVMPDPAPVEWIITRLDLPAEHLARLDQLVDTGEFAEVFSGANVVVLRRDR